MKERKADRNNSNNNNKYSYFSYQMSEKVLTIFPMQANSGLTPHSLLIFSEFSPDASLRFLAANLLLTPYSTEYQITTL